MNVGANLAAIAGVALLMTLLESAEPALGAPRQSPSAPASPQQLTQADVDQLPISIDRIREQLAREPAFSLNLWAAALIGLVVGLATMAGDLWESALKRRFGVKDSGDLIPGHGGLLDRVDGLMFAVVVMALARLANQWGWGH